MRGLPAQQLETSCVRADLREAERHPWGCKVWIAIGVSRNGGEDKKKLCGIKLVDRIGSLTRNTFQDVTGYLLG